MPRCSFSEAFLFVLSPKKNVNPENLWKCCEIFYDYKTIKSIYSFLKKCIKLNCQSFILPYKYMPKNALAYPVQTRAAG